jgi:hypothetical protein
VRSPELRASKRSSDPMSSNARLCPDGPLRRLLSQGPGLLEETIQQWRSCRSSLLWFPFEGRRTSRSRSCMDVIYNSLFGSRICNGGVSPDKWRQQEISTMAWKKVRAFLEAALIDRLRDPSLGRDWLDSLVDSLDGRRLGACIGIDLRSGAVQSELYVEVLNCLARPFVDPAEAFARALEGFPARKDLIARSAFNQAACNDSLSYVRVLDLAAFIKFYASPGYSYSLGDAMEVRRIFLEEFDGKTLEDVKTPWSGPRDRIWVLPADDLSQHEIPGDGDQTARVLNDVLGLGKEVGLPPSTPPELIYVRYPKDYDACACAQPTALDAEWSRRGGYYLSYANLDHWGRTQSCSGRPEYCRERVHGELPSGLDERFSASQIGRTAPVIRNRVALLRQAYRRFSSC